MEVSKVFNRMVGVDYKKFLTLCNSLIQNTKGNSSKLKMNNCTLEIRKYFFTNRVNRKWNTLKRRAVCSNNNNKNV